MEFILKLTVLELNLISDLELVDLEHFQNCFCLDLWILDMVRLGMNELEMA